MADFAPVAGWDYTRFTFVISGMIAAGTDLDGARYSPRDLTLTRATLHLRVNGGAAGSTTSDINVNGVSIFLPANRPIIQFNAGNDVTVEVTPDTTTISPADMITADIDTVVAAGFVQDVQIELIARGRA